VKDPEDALPECLQLAINLRQVIEAAGLIGVWNMRPLLTVRFLLFLFAL
jgi:hypothetical protein